MPQYRGTAEGQDKAVAWAGVVFVHAALAAVILSGLNVHSVARPWSVCRPSTSASRLLPVHHLPRRRSGPSAPRTRQARRRRKPNRRQSSRPNRRSSFPPPLRSSRRRSQAGAQRRPPELRQPERAPAPVAPATDGRRRHRRFRTLHAGADAQRFPIANIAVFRGAAFLAEARQSNTDSIPTESCPVAGYFGPAAMRPSIPWCATLRPGSSGSPPLAIPKAERSGRT